LFGLSVDRGRDLLLCGGGEPGVKNKYVSNSRAKEEGKVWERGGRLAWFRPSWELHRFSANDMSEEKGPYKATELYTNLTRDGKENNKKKGRPLGGKKTYGHAHGWKEPA